MQWALLMLMLMLIRKSIKPSAEERLALGTVMVMMIIFDYHYDDNDYYYDDDVVELWDIIIIAMKTAAVAQMR